MKNRFILPILCAMSVAVSAQVKKEPIDITMVTVGSFGASIGFGPGERAAEILSKHGIVSIAAGTGRCGLQVDPKEEKIARRLLALSMMAGDSALKGFRLERMKDGLCQEVSAESVVAEK